MKDIRQELSAQKRAVLIKRASLIALAGNALLCAVKLFFALRSHSLAVLGDGIDSLTDVLGAFTTLAVSKIIVRPGDSEHPWGHSRAETIAAFGISFIVFFAGAELVLQSARHIVLKESAPTVQSLALIASGISVVFKTMLMCVERYFFARTASPAVRATALNMQADIVLSSGIFVGIFLSSVLGMPILDPLCALFVGLWVIKNAFVLFKDLNRELMDGNRDSSLYQALFDAAKSVPGVTNPHKARIRRMASALDIDLDIEVNPAMSVYDAHELAEQVEEKIRERIHDVYDIVIHIEPSGSETHQRKEPFGLSPQNL